MAEQAPITTLDEFEEEYKSGSGKMLPSSASKQASFDNILRASDGIGDYNPLWRDEEYAGKQPLRYDHRNAVVHLQCKPWRRCGDQRRH